MSSSSPSATAIPRSRAVSRRSTRARTSATGPTSTRRRSPARAAACSRGSRRSRRRATASSALYASLVDKEQQLATMQALQTSNASLFKPARRRDEDAAAPGPERRARARARPPARDRARVPARGARHARANGRERLPPARPADPRADPAAAALPARLGAAGDAGRPGDHLRGAVPDPQDEPRADRPRPPGARRSW